MFNRRWLGTTVLVLLGTALCVRLGIWQLDRLEGRRAFNDQVRSMRSLPPLDLNTDPLDAVETMEWRAVRVSGVYDFENQIAIRNQYRGSEYGYHLFTPLLFPTSAAPNGEPVAVLVDRGWIPADGNTVPSDWRRYDQGGPQSLQGQIRLGSGKPAFGGVADAPPADGTRLEVWNNADVTRIAAQLPYPVLPIYLQPAVDPADEIPPIPFQPNVELTEGPHFGYAVQWFTFASILFVGYPFYLRKQETE